MQGIRPLNTMANINETVTSTLNPEVKNGQPDEVKKSTRKERIGVNAANYVRFEEKRENGVLQSSQVVIDFGGLHKPTAKVNYLYTGISTQGEAVPAIYRNDNRFRIKASVTLPVAPTITNLALEAELQKRDAYMAKIQALAAKLNGEPEKPLSEAEGDSIDSMIEAASLEAPVFTVNIPEIKDAIKLPKWAEVCDREETVNGVVYRYSVQQFNPMGFKKVSPRKNESRVLRETKIATSQLAFAMRTIEATLERNAFNVQQAEANKLPSSVGRKGNEGKNGK